MGRRLSSLVLKDLNCGAGHWSKACSQDLWLKTAPAYPASAAHQKWTADLSGEVQVVESDGWTLLSTFIAPTTNRLEDSSTTLLQISMGTEIVLSLLNALIFLLFHAW